MRVGGRCWRFVMLNGAIGISTICVVIGGCAGAPTSFQTPTSDPVAIAYQSASVPSRIRRVTNHSSRLKSVLLLPSAVKGMVGIGPIARTRVSVGSLFAVQTIGSDEVARLALVFQTVGGGLGATLSVRPSLKIVVDGEPVIEGPVFDPRLYTITPGPWGPVETVMVPILPILLDRIAHGASVDMVLGDAMRFGSIAPNAPASVTC